MAHICDQRVPLVVFNQLKNARENFPWFWIILEWVKQFVLVGQLCVNVAMVHLIRSAKTITRTKFNSHFITNNSTRIQSNLQKWKKKYTFPLTKNSMYSQPWCHSPSRETSHRHRTFLGLSWRSPSLPASARKTMVDLCANPDPAPGKIAKTSSFWPRCHFHSVNLEVHGCHRRQPASQCRRASYSSRRKCRVSTDQNCYSARAHL